MNPKTRRRLRQQLDANLQAIKAVGISVPRTGWIRTVRDALGMTAAQLGSRVGVTQPTLAGFERAETDRTITLRSLSEIAEALGCRLVYAFVPEESLEAMMRLQARQSAAQILRPVAHSMALEGQTPPATAISADIENLANDLVENSPRRIWDHP